MSDSKSSFFSRLALALRASWRMLVDSDFAGGVQRLEQGGGASPASAVAEPHKPAVLRDTLPDSALQLLTLLQQEGRFVDFLEENVTAYSDADIGGAARVVHEGCRKVIREYLHIEPVREEAEGARLTLPAGLPPFTGTLMHRGWRVSQITLPRLAEGHDVRVLAPAEVEL